VETEMILWIAAGVVGALIIAGVVYLVVSLLRRRRTQRHYGAEYDRLLDQRGSRDEVEQELRERERRHAEFELRDLDPDERRRFHDRWEQVQRRFVDEPETALLEADDLLREALDARGYPRADHERQAEDLSVEIGGTVERYRHAHQVAEDSRSGGTNTERKREALMDFRAVLDAVIRTGEAGGGQREDQEVRG
jgi:hypothetical protein